VGRGGRISAISQHDHAKPPGWDRSDWQEYAAVWQDRGGGYLAGFYDHDVTSHALAESGAASNPTISAFYFPNYHADPRNEAKYGRGWTEWDLLKGGVPRYPGHRQPLVPVWGYEDESDPQVMQRKITAATSHGIGNFLFDWYHYEDGPFLSRALDEGFLGAPNPEGMTFALMWANHDWLDIFPQKAGRAPNLHYPGKVSPQAFDRITDLIIERYFSRESYFRMDGLPFFSIYHLDTLAESFGGEREMARALERMRRRVEQAGLPGVHLNAIGWNLGSLQGELPRTRPFHHAAELGFDSATSYVWVHHVDVQEKGLNHYDVMADLYFSMYEEACDTCPIPVFPNVTMGWDPSPRTDPEGPWKPAVYPYSQVLEGNTPEAFGRAVRRAIDLVSPLPGETLVTLNAWNEWTEGSYLEPDTVYGMAYLEELRRAVRAGKPGHA
jgi:hypothetical protein